MRAQGKRPWAAWALLIAAAALIAVGALRGEIAVVLQKSITICMECIGLG